MFLAEFWAIFSQTHLVTLVGRSKWEARGTFFCQFFLTRADPTSSGKLFKFFVTHSVQKKSCHRYKLGTTIQGCQILPDTIYQNKGEYTKLQQITIQQSHIIHQPVTLPGPPKFTQIGIFGFKNTCTIWQPWNHPSLVLTIRKEWNKTK
jgi:hypothetical protein